MPLCGQRRRERRLRRETYSRLHQGDMREVRAPPSFSWRAVVTCLAGRLSISSTRTASSSKSGSSSNRPRGPARPQILRIRTLTLDHESDDLRELVAPLLNLIQGRTRRAF